MKILLTDSLNFFILILFPVDQSIGLGVGGRIFDLVDLKPTLLPFLYLTIAKKN